MNNLILCEGKTDAILLSYYLEKTCGWKHKKAPKGLDIKVSEIRGESAYWYTKEDKYLLICGVGGKDNFTSFFNEKIYPVLIDTSAFSKIAVVTDRNSRLEFNLVAEGIRKIALIWQLISNGVIREGSILFWDEPEANINPIYIPLLVDIMTTLQKNGIQLFISTHDYTLAKYFDIKTNEENIKFHSLYKTEDGVKCETNSKFKNLEKNTIRDTFIQLYKDEIQMEMGL